MSFHAQATESLPIILGAGFTGIAISHALSNAGVSHILVGQPPGAGPRLDESLNAEGSRELLERFHTYRQWFHPKNQLSLFFGANALVFGFEAKGVPRAYHEPLGFPSSVALFHVDRIGLDAALFDAATRPPPASGIRPPSMRARCRRARVGGRDIAGAAAPSG